MVTVGSVEELFQLSGVRVTDLHKESIDHITIPSKQVSRRMRYVSVFSLYNCVYYCDTSIIDHITMPSKQGRGTLKRIDEVFDW
jgi:hypothetical protein